MAKRPEERYATVNAFAEDVELPREDLVPEFVLRLEVVVEVALPTEAGTRDHVVDRGLDEALLSDELRGSVEDLNSASVHGANDRTDRS